MTGDARDNNRRTVVDYEGSAREYVAMAGITGSLTAHPARFLQEHVATQAGCRPVSVAVG